MLIRRERIKKNEHKLLCKGLMNLERLYEWNALFRIIAIIMFPVGVYAFL